MKRLRNQKGVALLLVLGSILILSTIVVEFAYNTHVSYELASSERDRLKAYYLARSAYNLVRLELKFEKEIRTRYADVLKDLKGSGVTADPLCRQVPLSTGLLKGISSGLLTGGTDEKGEDKNSEDAAPEKPKEAAHESILSSENFLSFDGDFEVTCDTEEKKINLNIFRQAPNAAAGTADGALSLYDSQKELLISLFSQKDYEPIFHEKPDEIRKVVNAIADWADRDDRINEAPGMTGDAEDSLYTGPEYHYKSKNGRYATVAEALLVAGVDDDLFRKMESQVTVYGDNKINLCQASEDMVKAFVTRYTRFTPGVSPIADTDDRKWAEVMLQLQLACEQPSVQPNAVATAIGGVIGATNVQAMTNQISTTNRFFRIEATGAVGESQSKIVAVIDAGSPSPAQWKTLYFRIE